MNFLRNFFGVIDDGLDFLFKRLKRRRSALNFFFTYDYIWVLIYLEIVFAASTTRSMRVFPFIYMVLFSICLGLAGAALCSLFKPNINGLIKKILFVVTGVLFGVEYFIYRQFKVFYDINTVRNGTNDVLFGGFIGDAFKLIFSPKGLLHILLFLLPFLLCLLFRRYKLDRYRRMKPKMIIMTLVKIPVIFLICLVLIFANGNYRSSFRKEYNFQTAVSNFGLMTALRMDIRHGMFAKDVSFDIPEDTAGSSAPEETASSAAEETSSAAEETTEPVVTEPQYNELDIDFAALAETTSGTCAALDQYVASLSPSNKNEYTGLFEGKNLILITAEAFSGDIIDPELTPTLYRMATKGINFNDAYVPATAGTTGGEYSHIFGMLPTSGGSSMVETLGKNNYYTMGSQLNRLGYYGKMYHNNSYTYYSRNETHENLGYSDGFMGYGNGMEEYVTKTWPESDLEMFQGTLPLYIDKDHFNIYYMTVSGHSGYNTGNAMAAKHWDEVQGLDYSDAVKAYYACNLELEAGLTWLINALEEAGKADDTVICLVADHFPYGLDDDAALGNMPYLNELYGYEVDTYWERDHNRILMWSGCLEDKDPIVVDDPVSSIDILPTLSNLFGLEYDSRLMPGRDVFSDTDPLVFLLDYEWKTDLGTYSNGTFTPKDDSVTIPDGYVDKIKSIVANKINYMKGYLEVDYFAHVFGDS